MTKQTREALVVDGISVSIGEAKIVHDCSFRVGKGEFVGIIGPNGAGKSTLLKSLRGMINPVAGNVSVYGHPIHKLGDKKAARLVAYMQQEVNAGFGFTALEVVLAGRYPYLKWWRNETDRDYRIARRYMTFTGVDHLEDKPVTAVSGGERQRILLAKVLTQETPLIFLDEPTASLDLVYQEEIFRHCRTVCQDGKSVLLIAHDIRLAAKFCSRLILLTEGRIVADGVPADVITPENLAKAYGLHSAVFWNKVTGNLDIHTYVAADMKNGQPVVHVIGGGGSTGNLIRVLHERCCRLTTGVLQEGDTDADVAEAFGVEKVSGPAFSAISEEQARDNRKKIVYADWVVLGNLCYGEQNLANLEMAFAASRLIAIEDEPVEGRDFTGGQATKLYRELIRRPQVQVMTSAQFVQMMERRGGCLPAEEPGEECCMAAEEVTADCG